MENALNSEALNQEIIEHLMHPKNYGKLDAPDGVGVGHDAATGEFVIFYVNVTDGIISDIAYATNGCQDTVVLGSMFTEMIKGDTVENSQKAVKKLEAKLSSASAQQQACAEMVLTAFGASLINRDKRLGGSGEEQHVITMKESCSTDEK
jgi:nitrogen fixation NifU-like protein